MDPDLTQVDRANLSSNAAKFLLDGRFPPLPSILSLDWIPPSQTSPVTQATNPGRIRIWANADSHDWQEMMVAIPGGEGAAAGQVMSYWDGRGPATYVMTLRNYWVLSPGSYTRLSPGTALDKTFTTTSGISQDDASSMAASLNVGLEGLGATITAEFSYSVTTSSPTEDNTPCTVQGPADGFTRVWMLWQLIDEVSAIDFSTGAVMANPVRHADVNWSDHDPSGAFVNYLNVQQIFPSEILVPLTGDFPTSS